MSVYEPIDSNVFDEEEEEEETASRATDADAREGRSPQPRGFPPPLDREPVVAFSTPSDTIKSAFARPLRSGEPLFRPFVRAWVTCNKYLNHSSRFCAGRVKHQEI
jgi:hypothetical protein